MKTFLALALGLALNSVCAWAQAGGNPSPAAPGAGGTAVGKASPAPQTNDGLMKQGARIVLMRGGQMTLLEASLTLQDGTRVDPDGTITRPDKTQAKLQPNQMITLAGVMAPAPAGLPSAGASSTSTPATPPIKAGDGTGAR